MEFLENFLRMFETLLRTLWPKFAKVMTIHPPPQPGDKEVTLLISRRRVRIEIEQKTVRLSEITVEADVPERPEGNPQLAAGIIAQAPSMPIAQADAAPSLNLATPKGTRHVL
jgi:hypothetical protein